MINWDKGLFYAKDILTDHTENAEHKWLGSDTEYDFDRNIWNAKNRGYTKDSITYKLNEYGFRSKSFSNLAEDANKYKILVTGCSHTFGIGNRLEETWPVIFQNMIPNSVMYNIALGGQSFDYCIQSLYKTVEIFKPNLICVLEPPEGRFIFPTDDNPEGWWHPMDDLYPKFLTSPNWQVYNREKNLSFLNVIGKANNAITVFVSDSEHLKSHPAPVLGRDAHFGLAIQESLAMLFKSKFDLMISS